MALSSISQLLLDGVAEKNVGNGLPPAGPLFGTIRGIHTQFDLSGVSPERLQVGDGRSLGERSEPCPCPARRCRPVTPLAVKFMAASEASGPSRPQP